MQRPQGPSFATLVIEWQRSHGRRGLPWQDTRDPYRVWLSEIMLQQTQVTTVLGYYERFLARFADVQSLAAAPLDDVLAMWSGLGYYSRARNLHRCAQAVVSGHGGSFPRSSAALEQLPGIGRSTAAAIAAFCFGERVAILDANVKRVLSRVSATPGSFAEPGPQSRLWQTATELLPDAGIEAYTQGLMDLGATVCLARAPLCLICPVALLCEANRTGTQASYPQRKARARRAERQHVWLWLRHRRAIWLVQRPAEGIWGGLWSLPEFESLAAYRDAHAAWAGQEEVLPTFTHTLTHLDWTLHPRRWTLPEATAETAVAAITRRWPTGRWFVEGEARMLGLPSPLRRLLATQGDAVEAPPAPTRGFDGSTPEMNTGE